MSKTFLLVGLAMLLILNGCAEYHEAVCMKYDGKTYGRDCSFDLLKLEQQVACYKGCQFSHATKEYENCVLACQLFYHWNETSK